MTINFNLLNKTEIKDPNVYILYAEGNLMRLNACYQMVKKFLER